jgi:hypothetical protein
MIKSRGNFADFQAGFVDLKKNESGNTAQQMGNMIFKSIL